MAKIPVQRAHTMWGKSREKKAARMYHTRNFGTGHVEPDEYYLSRIGLRGRKRWILLCSVVFGYLLVIGHFVLTCMILGVLHFDSTGPPYFIFNEDGSLTWPQSARITDVLLGSTLEAYNNQSLTLTGQNNQQVIFKSGNQRFSIKNNTFLNSSQMLFGPSEISVTSVKSFGIIHSGNQLLFANSSLVTMDSLSSISQLRTNRGLKTSTIRGPLDSDLTVHSGTGLFLLRGGNGVFMEGRQVNISSKKNLHLISHEGAILITGEEGIVLQGLPSQLPGSSGSRYQLCACAISRRLFLVPSNTERCAIAQDTDDICSTQ